MKRRALSLLLAVCLVWTLLPASAEEETAPEPVEITVETPAAGEATAPLEDPAESQALPEPQPPAEVQTGLAEEPQTVLVEAAPAAEEEAAEAPWSLADILRFDPPEPFAPEALDIKAKGAVALDFDTGEVYYEREADVPRPIASMTKVMSLYLFFEAMAQGRFTPDTLIPISPYAAEVSGHWAYSGKERFYTGEEVPASTLIALILTASANASVIALAEYLDGSEAAFTQRMNDRAAEWGLTAHFSDCTGYESEGAGVTPMAMAQIACRIIREYPAVLDYAMLPEAVHRGRSFPSTNRLLLERAVEGIDGLKTGWTTTAGHCFTGTACRDGRRIVTVVMDAGSALARMTESAKLLEYGFACREAREAQWAAAGEGLKVDFAQTPANLCPYLGLRRCTLTFRDWGDVTPKALTVEVGGTAWSLEPQTLRDGGEAAFFVAGTAEGPVQVTVTVTLPNGASVRRSGAVSLGRASATERMLLGRTEAIFRPVFAASGSRMVA